MAARTCGRKFARIEFASTGRPRGYVLHAPAVARTTSPFHDHASAVRSSGDGISVRSVVVLVKGHTDCEAQAAPLVPRGNGPDDLHIHVGIAIGAATGTTLEVEQSHVIQLPATELNDF